MTKKRQMTKLRITPIVLAIGGLFSWLIWQFWYADIAWTKGLSVLLLFVILVVADQYFRILYKDMGKIWLIEAVFLVLVFVIAWLVNRYL